jgi:hypothetical protein
MLGIDGLPSAEKSPSPQRCGFNPLRHRMNKATIFSQTPPVPAGASHADCVTPNQPRNTMKTHTSLLHLNSANGTKTFKRLFALSTLALTPYVASAQTAPPTTVTGTQIVATSTVSGLVARGMSSSQMTGNANLGIGLFSLGGSFSRLVDALTTSVDSAVVDIQGGSTVTGSRITTTSTINQVELTGAKLTSAVVKTGSLPK